MVAHAVVDIGALRNTRRRTGLTNTLVRHPFQAYLAHYEQTVFKPANQLLNDDGSVRSPGKGELGAMQRADIERLVAAGILR